MDWTEPASVVMAPGTAAVIRALAGADGRFGIRELGRLAGVSPNRTSRTIATLADHGLVLIDDRPGSKLVQLNREHLASGPVVALATLRSQVFERLRTEFSGWPLRAVHVSLFGSAARGGAGPDSDIDLLVVHPHLSTAHDQERWDDQLVTSGDRIHRWTGNWVGWFRVSGRELGRMAAAGEPIVEEWRRDAIALYGPPLAELLRRTS